MLNEGKTVAEVARSAYLTETTWHRWENTYGEMKAKRLKELEAESRKLFHGADLAKISGMTSRYQNEHVRAALQRSLTTRSLEGPSVISRSRLMR
jgi:hypothetical protein